MFSKVKVFKGYYVSILTAILLPFCVPMAVWEYQLDVDVKIMAYLFAYFLIYLFLFSMLIESLNIGLKKYLFYVPCCLYIFLLSTQYFNFTSIIESNSLVREINYRIPIIDSIVIVSLIATLTVCNRGKTSNVKYEYPLIIQYVYIIVPFGLFFISMSQSSFGIFAIVFFTPALIISILSQILFYILYQFVSSQNLKFYRNKLKYYYLILQTVDKLG